VLICPGCQVAYDWTSDLDRCPVCASVHLVRRLGEVECRDCGSVRQSAAPALPGHLSRPAVATAGSGESAARGRRGAGRRGGEVAGASTDAADGLAREVEAALARVLGRTAGSGAARG
jgi:hypothetical protein